MGYLDDLMPVLKADIEYALRHTEAYSYKIGFPYPGYPKFIYGGLDKATIYMNSIEKYPITQIIEALKVAFPRCYVFYDEIQGTIRVRLRAE
jgi:hypothetical protein